MSDTYSLYEAKARLSALVRLVREGRSVTITVHGRPVAELRPFQPADRPPTLEERVAVLAERGGLSLPRRAPSDPLAFQVGPRKPGALRRFLDQRE